MGPVCAILLRCRERRCFIVVALLALLVTACSSSRNQTSTRSAATGVVPRAPKVAPAQITGPITAGHYVPPAGRSYDLAAAGYVEQEFFASGTASSYAADGDLAVDGRWSLHPVASAPYRTRIVVRRPRESGKVQRHGRR